MPISTRSGTPATARSRALAAGSCVLIAMLLGANAAQPAALHASRATLALVPAPQSVEMRAGSTTLSARWNVATSGDRSDSLAAAGVIAELGDRIGRPVEAGAGPIRTLIFASVPADPTTSRLFNEQGYRLTIARDRIIIEGATPTGRFYGAQTLRQLIRASTDATLPCLAIVDAPALEWRGVSDDVSRGQMSTPADLLEIIHRLAGYKMNLYQLYIEDAFAFRSAPEIGRGRARLTASELEAVVEEGRRYHVVVTPIFETLGHQERLLSIPAYRRHAELSEPERHGLDALVWNLRAWWERSMASLAHDPPDPPRIPSTFSAVSPESRAFVLALVDEIAAAAPGPFFHIGGDETGEIGQGTSRAAVNQLGAGRVHGRYCAAVIDHLRARDGRRAMLYTDMILSHPEALAEIPRDAILVDWHYNPADPHPSIRALHDAGFRDVMVSPGLWSWDTFYPDYGRAFASILGMSAEGKREGALGCVVASWGDNGAENLRENNWLGYAFAASAAWEAGNPDTASFCERFVTTEFGVRSPQIARALRLVGWQRFDGLKSASRLVHRAPLVRVHRTEWMDRMRLLRSDMLVAEDALSASRTQVRYHADEISALALCALRFRTSAERELVLDAIAARPAFQAAGTERSADTPQAMLLLDSIKAAGPRVRAEYAALWLRHNRPEGLDSNVTRLDHENREIERLSFPESNR
jgi:hypothetical protein